LGVSSDTSAYADGGSSTLELVRTTLPAIKLDAVREIYSLRDDDATAEATEDGDDMAWPSLIEKAEAVDAIAARNSNETIMK
jgi:hypothetical protein